MKRELRKLEHQLMRVRSQRDAELVKMRKSDAYAARAVKLGVPFAELYPDKYEEYTTAYDKYQEFDTLVKQLEDEIRNVVE